MKRVDGLLGVSGQDGSDPALTGRHRLGREAETDSAGL